MKEPVTAARDIKKGEVMTDAVNRTEGYFYFFDGKGNAFRAAHAHKTLTPEQRAIRDKLAEDNKKAVAIRKLQRAATKASKAKAALEAQEARKKARQAKIDAKIAELQSKKASV